MTRTKITNLDMESPGESAGLAFLTDGAGGVILSGVAGGHNPLTVVDTTSLNLELTGQALSGYVIESGLDHGLLAGLVDNDHPQYSLSGHLHDGRYYIESEVDALLALQDELSELDDVDLTGLAQGDFLGYDGGTWVPSGVQGGAGHSAVTVTDTASLNLELTGQALSGYVLESGLDHGLLAGLGDDDHPQYSLSGHLHDGRYSLLEHLHDDRYSLSGHLHDDRYYIESEVDALLALQDELSEMTDTSVGGVTQGEVLTYDGADWVPSGVAGIDTDELIKVSSNDTTANYLEDKIAAGSNITLAILNEGANEQLEVTSTGSGGGSAIEVFDEGSSLTTGVTSLDFVGEGVTATATGNDVTVTISGTGSGSGLVAVIASGVVSWNVNAGSHEFDIDLSPYSITTGSQDLQFVGRVHEREDNSNLSGGGDYWSIAEAWFFRTDNSQDETDPPTHMTVRVFKETGAASGYDLLVDWWILDSTAGGGGGGVSDHGDLTGLSDDDHSQYALLAGRSGGQTLLGGTSSGDKLVLSTTDLSEVVVNDAGEDVGFRVEGKDDPNLLNVVASGNLVGIGIAVPQQKFHIGGIDGTDKNRGMEISGNRPFIFINHDDTAGFAGGIAFLQNGDTEMEFFYDSNSNDLLIWDTAAGSARVAFNIDGDINLYQASTIATISGAGNIILAPDQLHSTKGLLSVLSDVTVSGSVYADTFQSDVGAGTAPFVVASPTVVNDLNADLLDGMHALDLRKAAWPVNSVYIAVVSTNPATLLGFGTWAAFGTGRVLVGIDGGDTDFDTVEETGGAKTIELTTAQMPSHTHIQDSHNHTQNAHNHTQNAHNHNMFSGDKYIGATSGATGGVAYSSGGWGGLKTGTDTATNIAQTATNIAATAVNQSTGGGDPGFGMPHDNVQPYIVVYMWKRTA